MKRKSKSLVSLVSCLALLAGMLWCPFTTPRANAADIHYRVNCGGSAYTDTAGNSWSADKTYASGSWGYVSGTKKSVTNAINNTNDDPLFQSYTYASTLEYKFDNIPNGEYTVKLNFSEDYWSATGKRVFDVYIENIKVLSAFDIYANAGKYTALTKTFTATVSDGQLNIKGVKSVDNAQFNAIEFYSNTTTPPPSGNGPTDNPISAKYGSAYPWTDNIKWSNVENILDYGGDATGASDNIAAFNSARDTAASEGGGVVYFPAGTYKFIDNIYLKNGVVIRGATPTSGDAKVSGYAPPTKFEFPKYNPTFTGSGTSNSTAFKYIYTATPNTDSNIGIVNVDINRAGVSLLGDADAGTNTNVVVYGIRTNNVASPDPGVPDTTYQNAWQRWCYRFSCNIAVQAYSNVLVANTRNNDNITDNFQQPGYIIKNGTANMVLTGDQAVFNYTNHYGINVNRNKSGGYISGATKTQEPSLFRTGITIRDNYVFHTMRIAITASGTGLDIRSNIVRDQSDKVAWVDPTGKKLVGNSTTLENRGIDWSGENVTVTGNDIRVYRHKLKDTIYYSVDGEGILIQEVSGGTVVNGVTISNNILNAYIGLYKIKDINGATIEGNSWTDTTGTGIAAIYVHADTNSATYHANNVIIRNNTNVAGDIDLIATLGGSGNSITNNTAMGTRNINISSALSVSVSGNTGFTTVIK